MTTTFETAKVGDKVWDFMFGVGKVVDIINGEYPIVVDFENERYKVIEQFTYEGTLYKFPGTQTLFWSEIEIVAPRKPLPKDTKVYVWVDGGSKLARHISHFNEQGRAVCYNDGQTSWTTSGHTSSWDFWELVE